MTQPDPSWVIFGDMDEDEEYFDEFDLDEEVDFE